MTATVGRVASPPRPSSAQLRGALQILRTLDKDGGKSWATDKLQEMLRVQKHNEDIFDVVKVAVEEADARIAEAEDAETRQREAAQSDMEALKAKEADLEKREGALATKQDEFKTDIAEAKKAAKAREDDLKEREQAVARAQKALDLGNAALAKQIGEHQRAVAQTEKYRSALEEREGRLRAVLAEPLG